MTRKSLRRECGICGLKSFRFWNFSSVPKKLLDHTMFPVNAMTSDMAHVSACRFCCKWIYIVPILVDAGIAAAMKTLRLEIEK